MDPEIVRPYVGDNPPTAKLYYGVDVIEGLRLLPDASVHMIATSPPFWGLRDYGTGDKQIGLEETPEEYVEKLVAVFREAKRVLRPDGTLWLNLGDSYTSQGGGGEARMCELHGTRETDFRKGALVHGRSGKRPYRVAGLKPKDLVGIPWRVALALQADGWFLRSDIVWSKGACMPESVRDRPTKAHEYVFLLAHPDSKGRYFYDAGAIREPPRSGGKVTPWQEREFDQTMLPEKHHQKEGRFGRVKGRPHGIAGFGEGGRNKRSVWNVNQKPYPGAHFAVWPPELVTPMVRAGCPPKGTVLDLFSGSATTGFVALRESRDYIGLDLNADYLPLAKARVLGDKAPRTDSVGSDEDLIWELFG